MSSYRPNWSKALPVAAVLVAGFLGGMNLGVLIGIIIPGILFFASVAIISSQPEEDRKLLTRLFLIAFVLRAGIGMTIYLLDLTGYFAGDADTYDGFGILLADHWSGHGLSFRTIEVMREKAHQGYVVFIACLYYVTGHQPLVGLSINWIIGSLTVFLAFLIAKKMFDRRVAVYSAIFAAVMPGFVIWEAQLLKDPIIIFCICLCVYSAMNLQERFNLFYGLLWMVTLFILFYFRIYIFYILGATSALSLLVGQRIGLIPMIIIMTILFGSFIFIAQKSGFTAQVAETQERQFQGKNAFEKMDNLRKSLTGGGVGHVGSAYLVGADISTPEKAVAFLPLGIIYLLLAPFPWMMTNFRQIITLPEMLVWWYLIPSLIRGLVYGVRNRFSYISSPLLFSIGLTLMYALFQGNAGTAYRQRAQIFIFYFIFISAGLLLKKSKGDEASH